MKTRIVAPLLLGLVLLPFAALGQPGRPSAPPQLPVRQALAEAPLSDGTLKKGMSGQFDPRGWEMRTKASGEPYFVGVPGAALADENWDPSFSTAWPDQPYVYAITVHGTDVYIGGEFSSVGTTVARNIARWAGAQRKRRNRLGWRSSALAWKPAMRVLTRCLLVMK